MKNLFRLLEMVLLLDMLSVGAATFTVSNVNDSGIGSLRQAILDANKSSDADTIEFNINQRQFPTVPTIKLVSPLPAITQPVVIDGTTERTGKIELDGSSAGAAASGLRITGGNSKVKGLAVYRFAMHGIILAGPKGGNAIEQCFIGTDRSGKIAFPNRGNGILITNSPNNRVGGFSLIILGQSTDLRNVISGNGLNGIEISGLSAVNNQIPANFIGTDISGTAALGNAGDGVKIDSSALGNTIGGGLFGARNIISGNGGNGIQLASVGTQVLTTYTSADVPKLLSLTPAQTMQTNGFIDQATNSLTVVQGVTDPLIDVDVQVTLNYQPVNGMSLSVSGPTGVKVDLSDYDAFVDLLGSNNGYGANFKGTIFDDEATASLPYYTAPYGPSPANPTGRFQPKRFSFLSTFDYLPAEGNWMFNVNVDRSFLDGDHETNTATLVSWSLLLTTAHGNEVFGNLIGTDLTGLLPLGNGVNGVMINGSSGNRIGGSTAPLRNTISGNKNDGVQIAGVASSANVVRGNFIGITADGTRPLGNGFSGISLFAAVNNLIGGVSTEDGNIIGGNNFVGVFVGAAASHNRVQKNFIGTDPTMKLDLGNHVNGMRIEAGSSDNLIGGTISAGQFSDYVVPFAGNTIAYSGDDAVLITDFGGNSLRDRIAGNNFLSNHGMAINLGKLTKSGLFDKVTPNDGDDDADNGPNRLQNFPILGPAYRQAPVGYPHEKSVILKSLTATTPTTDVLGGFVQFDYYASDTGNPLLSGARQIYLGGENLLFLPPDGAVLDGSTLRLPVDTLPLIGQYLTATSTDPDGNTSEFSAGVPILPGVAMAIRPHMSAISDFSAFGQVGQLLAFELDVYNGGPDSGANVILTNQLPPEVDFVSATSSQGTCTNINGTVICDLGTLDVGTNAAAKIFITVLPTMTGQELKNGLALTSSTSPFSERNYQIYSLLNVRDPILWRYELGADGFKVFVPTNGNTGLSRGFEVDSTGDLSPPILWQRFFNTPSNIVGDQFVFTNRITATNTFFRLQLY